MMIHDQELEDHVDDAEEGVEHGGRLSRRSPRCTIVVTGRSARARLRPGSGRNPRRRRSIRRAGSSRRPAAAAGRRAGHICGCFRCGSTVPPGEGEAPALDCELDVARGDEVHFDPAEHVVPARLVAESVERNIAVQLAVDAAEQVQVELGGDAFRVVIGGDQPLDRASPGPCRSAASLRCQGSCGNGAAGRSRSAARNCRWSSQGRSRGGAGRRSRRAGAHPW